MRIKADNISTYRQALVGFAMFAVMFSHWFGFQAINSGIPYKISTLLTKPVFTEGLLFLSGFGLYYSFSKNQDIKGFYKRRLLRLFIPFLILSFPLYTFFLAAREGYGFTEYVGQLSTTYFWFGGNYGGMWYVSVSVLLYLLFPFVYKTIFRQDGNNASVIVRTAVVLGVVYLALWGLRSFAGDYYDLVEIGIVKIPFFIIGILAGFAAKDNRLSDTGYHICLAVITLAYLILTVVNHRVDGYWLNHATGVFQKLFFIPLLCIVLGFLGNGWIGKAVTGFFGWFGKYSLELYILHLHFYMFFHYGPLNAVLPDVAQASLAMLLALLLCRPVNKLLAWITARIRNDKSLGTV